MKKRKTQTGQEIQKTQEKKLPKVFMFKNQTDFRKDQTTDLKMLKTSIKQWNKLYQGNDENYICGEYSPFDLDEIKKYLGDDFIERYSIKVINCKIPSRFKISKTAKINFQMLEAFKVLQQEYVFCVNDIFPIKKITQEHLNKEYLVKYNDYTKIKDDAKFWWVDNYIKFLEFFNKKHNTDFKKIYEGHNFYTIDEEFIEYFLSEEFYVLNCDRNVVKTHFLLLKNKEQDLFIPDLIGTTFKKNKFVLDKKSLMKHKGINVTLPNHPKSKSLLSKILVK